MLDLEKIKREARESLQGKRPLFFLLILITIIVKITLIPILVGVLLMGVFKVSLFLISKKLLDDDILEVDLLFEPFKDIYHLMKIIAVFLLRAIVVIIGLVLLIIPGLIMLLTYSMALFILAENRNLSVADALDQSSDLMRNHKTELFLLILSFFGHFILVVLTLGIYGIYFLPYFYVCIANYYLHLSNQKEAINKIAIEPDEYFKKTL